MIKTAAAVALVALQGAALVAADAAAHASAAVATGDVCSSGGNIIGIALDSSGSVSSTNFDIARTQVC